MSALSRRDFLGSVACAFAVVGIACKIPKPAIVDAPRFAKPVEDLRSYTAGDVFQFVVQYTNSSGSQALDVPSYGTLLMTDAHGLCVGDTVQVTL